MTDDTNLKVGEKAPLFETKDSEGNSVSLKEIISDGKSVVLYFYPKDNTPGCTVQACDLRDNMEKLVSNDVVVLGVSKDSGKSHNNFIEKQSLNFPLLLDEDLEIHKKYNVWKEKSMYGKKYMGTARSTFIINKDGFLDLVGYNVKTKRHADLVIDELKI